MTQRSRIWQGLAMPVLAQLLSLSFYSTAHADARQCTGEDKEAGFIISYTKDVKVFPKGSEEPFEYETALSDYSNENEKRLICDGDTIRTGVKSNAVLSITNREQLNKPDLLLTIESNSIFTIEEREQQESDDTRDELPVRQASISATLDYCLNNLKKAWLFLEQGAIHIFTEEPQSLNINTPYMNASVEGTEFTVAVGKEIETQDQRILPADSTLVAVSEGRVNVCNELSDQDLIVRAGQSAFATKGQAPILEKVIPDNAVQWALYYPRLNTDQEDANPKALAAYDFLTQGRIEAAQAELVGQTDDFSQALKATIAVTQNNRVTALEIASEGLADYPNSAPLWLAKSYAQQANFDLKGALESVEEAKGIDSTSADIWARLAELQQIGGQTVEALESAGKAVDSDGKISRGHTVEGFIKLSRFEIEGAKASFNSAIATDEYDPLPRLGLGLALIRKNKLKQGLDTMASAVILDPLNPILRSYFGKSYAELNQSELASEQYKIAEQYDPKDPTPYLYKSILAQAQNRPVQALYEIRDSIARNKNRAVYRSRFQLDSDLASRSISQANIYNELGFERLALTEGGKAVAHDYTNYTAHRNLADANLQRPRHEIARVSELFISQMLQPINNNPAQSSLAETRLSNFNGLGPIAASLNEYNPYFVREREVKQVGLILGENNTKALDAIVSGLEDNSSYAVSGFYSDTNGFFENHDENRKSLSVFWQNEIDQSNNIQLEYRLTDIDRGETFIGFDPDDFNETLRFDEKVDSFRLGYHLQSPANNHLLFSARYQSADESIVSIEEDEFGEFFQETLVDESGYQFEVQDILKLSKGDFSAQLVTGLGYFKANRKDTDIIDGDPLVLRSNPDHKNYYVYLNTQYKNFSGLIGATYDDFDGGIINENQLNPKVGFVLTSSNVNPTTLRFSAFRTLKRTLLSDQTLEPTTIAGFTQFFDDVEATDAKGYGLGIDQQISSNFSFGIDLFKRDLTVPVEDFDNELDEVFINIGDISENEIVLELRYVTQFADGSELSITPGFRREVFDRELFFEDREQIVDLNTKRYSVELNYFHHTGFRLGVLPQYIDQSGDFIDRFFEEFSGSDSFFVMDISAGYRLKNGKGLFQVLAKNVFNEKFNFQDTDPFNSRVAPERAIFVNFTMNF